METMDDLISKTCDLIEEFEVHLSDYQNKVKRALVQP